MHFRGDNGGFSQEQLDMYKECFKLMDVDKDGTISKNDLRAAFDNVGKLMDESELDSMLGEVGGSCSYDNMIKMFQEKMAGGEYYSICFLNNWQRSKDPELVLEIMHTTIE